MEQSPLVPSLHTSIYYSRLDLIESDYNGFLMPDQDELKFTDREIDDVQSCLLDKFTEFEEASQCLSLAPSTNNMAQDRVKEALVVVRQKAEGIILQVNRKFSSHPRL